MRVISGHSLADTLLKMYGAVFTGATVSARGSVTRNIHNMAVILPTDVPVITDFAFRKFNLKYAKQEWLWYLGADKFDDSIEQHATMWKKLKQADGSYHSNYGQYLFADNPVTGTDQFTFVVSTLKHDKDSRRASMVLLSRDHLYDSNSDVVCTYAINFTINEGALDMTVMMRSNDVIFGFTNDAFCFWNLYQFVYVALLPFYPSLKRGSYTHFTNSMHVYERHFAMIRDILAQGEPGFIQWTVPTPTIYEVHELVNSRGKGDVGGKYTEWLKA